MATNHYPDFNINEYSALIVNSLTIVGVVAIVCFTLLGFIAFKKTEKGAAKSFGLLFQRGDFLKLLTVISVVSAVLFLSLADKLTQGAISLLSGLAGYILGTMNLAKKDESNIKD